VETDNSAPIVVRQKFWKKEEEIANKNNRIKGVEAKPFECNKKIAK
jgi:hypothetical protein